MFELAKIVGLLPAFALVLMRITGVMLTAPIFSAAAIPMRIKALLVATISMVVFPLVRIDMTKMPSTLLGTAAAGGTELLIGLTIGLAVNLLFVALQLGGQVIAQQMGLGLARVFNPTLNSEVGILSTFYVVVGTALLLTMNGHHLIISGVLDSFKALPPMTATVQGELLSTVRGLLVGCYVLALKMAVPTLVILLLVSLIMGFLGKTVPQLNILVVGFPLRIGVGLIALIATFGVTLVVFSSGYRQTVDAVREMISQLGT